MKKLFFIGVLAVASLASCKKDRVCTCITTDSKGATTTSVTTMYKVTKGDAREGCIGSQTATTSGSITLTGDKTTCELK